VVIDGVTFKKESSNKLYVQLFYGVCEQSDANDDKSCIAWDDSTTWKSLDDMNKLVSSFRTDFQNAADFAWPNTFRIAVTSLVITIVLVVFFVAAIIMKEVKWGLQITAAVIQFILMFCLVFHLAYGLSTDTVLSGSWRTYYLGCNIHSEPGAGWWGGLLGALISLFSGVLMVFPYMMGPLWVAFGRTGGGAVHPGLSADDHEISRRHAAGLDDQDPYRAIEFRREQAVV
jgi:hypothetical protein